MAGKRSSEGQQQMPPDAMAIKQLLKSMASLLPPAQTALYLSASPASKGAALQQQEAQALLQKAKQPHF